MIVTNRRPRMSISDNSTSSETRPRQNLRLRSHSCTTRASNQSVQPQCGVQPMAGIPGESCTVEAIHGAMTDWISPATPCIAWAAWVGGRPCLTAPTMAPPQHTIRLTKRLPKRPKPCSALVTHSAFHSLVCWLGRRRDVGSQVSDHHPTTELPRFHAES